MKTQKTALILLDGVKLLFSLSNKSYEIDLTTPEDKLKISEEDVNDAGGHIRDSKEKLLGLLDFYSARATAHASLSIAVVFGVFGLLALYKWNLNLVYFEYSFEISMFSAVNSAFFIVAYIVLWLGAIYLALNFGWYTQIADRVKFLLLEHENLIKAFAAYRKCKPDKTIDDFLNASTQADWLYETSKGIIYNDNDIEKNPSLLTKMEEERKIMKYKWFHRRYLGFKRFFIERKVPLEAEYLSPEMWKEFLRICRKEGDVPEEGNYKKSFTIYLGLVILAILIFAIKFISDLGA